MRIPLPIKERLTRQQMEAIKIKYTQSKDHSKSYLEFRRRWYVSHMVGCVMGEWCGMFIGIEKDGYTHS